MKAVGITRTGGPEVLGLLDLPEPSTVGSDADGLVIEVAAAAVNPVDLATRSGLIPTALPAVLGWDLAGTVVHAPQGSGFGTGDRVMAMTAQLGTGVGSMAEFVRFDAAHVARVPDALSLTAAAALPLAGVTAVQALRRTPARSGRRVLLVGAQGSVGAQLALRLLDEPDTRTDLLVRPGDGEVWRELRAARPGGGAVLTDTVRVEGKAYDIVVDTAGAPDLIEAVCPGGVFLSLTPFSAPDPARRPDVEFTLVGVQLNGDDLAEVADRAARDVGLRPRTTVLPFADAAEAHRRLEAGGFRGKFVLVP
ncbi:alcohol dehydrogenase catalytic domain-containing protein [Streptacidiphilus fuscans]|uniref:Zinc-binding dehydrogenase n=1 Tax=Streptacidiphilus fuscans TaxID=2789292 RepID=A0A931B3Z5_9ACTN|nr:zinc-binding dehydrogenase [Streptacidiphilus fuscans]MBF9067508.1 zinc-binding dehydrogenase [Streptacidiphilus fuscans]